MEYLSSVGDVMAIRKMDRRHAIDLAVQIVRISASDKFKFFTCAIKASPGDDQLRNFSVKCWANELSIVAAINTGDVVSFSKLWKKHDGRRSVGNYQMHPTELDVEFFIWQGSSVTILQSFHQSEIRDYSIIRGAMTNVQVFGDIHRIADDQVIILRDNNNNMMEVLLQMGNNFVIREDETWCFAGNITTEDGMIILRATSGYNTHNPPPINDAEEMNGVLVVPIVEEEIGRDDVLLNDEEDLLNDNE